MTRLFLRKVPSRGSIPSLLRKKFVGNSPSNENFVAYLIVESEGEEEQRRTDHFCAAPTHSNTLRAILLCRLQCSTAIATIRPPTHSQTCFVESLSQKIGVIEKTYL